MAQQSQISSPKRRALNDFSLSICDADNLADYQSYLTSTHTNCLIQLLKSGWLSLSSQPRRAFYSSLIYCQAVFRRISSIYSITCASDQTSFSSAGGAFYSVQTRCQHLVFYRFRSPWRSLQKALKPPFRARRILHSFRCFATPLFKLTSCFLRSFPRGRRRKRCAL